MSELAPRRRLTTLQDRLNRHVRDLGGCRSCGTMIGPVVAPPPVASPVYLVGQAPGRHEGALGRPFAWTAGKTLFKWFASLGPSEADFRARVYMAAVCRCFPGKSRGGGDRVPSAIEIGVCAHWMAREIEILRPRLVIPVGKLAIAQVLGRELPLVEVVGSQRRASVHGHPCDVIALPHPSGASTWFRREPGSQLLQQALERIGEHAAWRAAVAPSG